MYPMTLPALVGLVVLITPLTTWAQPTSERARIGRHLERVEHILRHRDTEHLSEEVARARLERVDALARYWTDGDFPVNRHAPNRSEPTFIDVDGVPCAVGHLLLLDGQAELATLVAATMNHAYLRDVSLPALDGWAARNGLTADELSLIQPSYGWCDECWWDTSESVCGSDGVLYPPQCLECYDVLPCAESGEPVCGADQITYANDCQAMCAEQWTYAQGACAGDACTSIGCDDGDACTEDTCHWETGCVHLPVTCDDLDVCTEDSCLATTGCRFTPLSCDDEDACTDDLCESDIGCAHQPVGCDDGEPCTADTCDPTWGCSTVLDASCCSAGFPCGPGEACTEQSCVPVLCEPCEATEDCEGEGAACVPMLSGDFCATACSVDAPCPSGHTCTVDQLCMPDGGDCRCDALPTSEQCAGDVWVDLDGCGARVGVIEPCARGCVDDAGCCPEGTSAVEGACQADPEDPTPVDPTPVDPGPAPVGPSQGEPSVEGCSGGPSGAGSSLLGLLALFGLVVATRRRSRSLALA